jgi:hypothetical protein
VGYNNISCIYSNNITCIYSNNVTYIYSNNITCIYSNIHVFIQIILHVFIQIILHVFIQIPDVNVLLALLNVYIYVYIYMCIYIYVYIYLHKDIYTYIGPPVQLKHNSIRIFFNLRIFSIYTTVLHIYVYTPYVDVLLAILYEPSCLSE